MAVNMIIEFNGKYLELPVNPEKISIQRIASNEDLDIIGLGKATRKGEPGLISFTIESFFPGQNSNFYTGSRPKSCVKFINEIWETENINNNVAKLTVTGIPLPINMYFVIDSFEYDHRAGEEDDIYYTLKIKKYIPYGVKLVETENVTNNTVRVSSTSIQENTPSIQSQKTYTVKSGDCLFNITKACTGKGSDWNALYQLNKEVIGANPSLIKPGQVLTLPTNWNQPKNITKLKPISTKTTQKLNQSNGYVNIPSKNSSGGGEKGAFGGGGGGSR